VVRFSQEDDHFEFTECRRSAMKSRAKVGSRKARSRSVRWKSKFSAVIEERQLGVSRHRRLGRSPEFPVGAIRQGRMEVVKL